MFIAIWNYLALRRQSSLSDVHIENQENMTQKEGRREELMETYSEMTQMIELVVNKHYSHWSWIQICLQTSKNEHKQRHERQNRTQFKLLEMKTSTAKVKRYVGEVKWLDTTKERVHRLKDIATEVTQDAKKEKWGQWKHSTSELRDSFKQWDTRGTGASKGKG